MINKAIRLLSDLPFYQWLALVGVALLLGSGGIEVMSISIPMVNPILTASIGGAMIGFAGITNIVNKILEDRRQERDVMLRMKLQDGGLSPKDDKTVVRPK